MAEVLIALEVAGCITEVVQGLYDYIAAVKGAKDEILRLTQELFALKGALEHFDAQTSKTTGDGDGDGDGEASGRLNPTVAAEVQGMLRMTRDTLDAIQKKLTAGLGPSGPGSSRLGRAVAVLKWPLRSDDVAKYLATLERAKTWFIMVIMRDANETVGAVYAEVQQLAGVVHEDVVSRKLEQMQLQAEEVVKWLSPCDSAEELARACVARVPGTGQWIWDGEFAEWEDGPKRTKPIYWITGKCRFCGCRSEGWYILGHPKADENWCSRLGKDHPLLQHRRRAAAPMRERPDRPKGRRLPLLLAGQCRLPAGQQRLRLRPRPGGRAAAGAGRARPAHAQVRPDAHPAEQPDGASDPRGHEGGAGHV
jgi:hypothetical protein